MKKLFLSISLLCVYHLYSKVKMDESPITIEFPGLAAVDSMHMVNIPNISDYRDKADLLITFVIDKKNNRSLADYVAMEEEGLLSDDDKKTLFNLYTAQFLKISKKYFNDIRHLKPVLVELIGVWAKQRNCPDSLVLSWASIEHGKEEQFVKDYAPTLKAFYTFLIDLDILLADIMHSCPKTYAHYLECKKRVEEKHNPAASAA